MPKRDDGEAGTAQTTGNKWVKGMSSPNPRGRPPTRKRHDLFKAVDPLAAAFIEHDQRTLSKADGKRITRGEAAIEKLYKEAMGGDMRALTYYLDKQEAAYRHRDEVNEKMLEAAVAWKERYRDQFALAQLRGKPAPQVLPHPDDVQINPDGTVNVVGPVTWEDKERLDHLLKQREEFRAMVLTALQNLEFEGVPEKVETFRRLWKKFHKEIPPRLHEEFPTLD